MNYTYTIAYSSDFQEVEELATFTNEDEAFSRLAHMEDNDDMTVIRTNDDGHVWERHGSTWEKIA